MKKTLSIALIFSFAAAAANAALLAGWDFSQFTTDGSDDVDFTYVSQNSLKANYSDLGTPGLGSASNPFGEVTWNTAGAVVANGTNLTSGQSLSSLSSKVNSFDSANVSDGGQLGSGSFSAQAEGEALTFEITAGSTYQSLAFQFGAATYDSSAGTVDVLAGTSVGNLSAVGSQISLTSAQNLYTVSLASLGSASTFYVQFQGSNNALFDNVAFTGTVVPEPSVYATIAGALALAFVMVRRRK